MDYERGFLGSWKKIPNLISSVDLKLVQPWELDTRIEELFLQWEASSKSLHNIAEFHAKFENIHPFADGNGRTGRLAMNYFLIMHEHPPIIIHEDDRKDYYTALEAWDIRQDLDVLCSFLREQTAKTWEKQIARMEKNEKG